MTPGDDYTSPVYGSGTVISVTAESFRVRFDSPPGMLPDARGVVPVVEFTVPHA